VVVKVNPLAMHAELARESRAALAIARKFAPEVRSPSSKRSGSTWTHRRAQPVRVLEPVEIGGVTVTTATLHNFDLIEAKDIREGDWVEVTRAAKSSRSARAVRERRTGKERKFKPRSVPRVPREGRYPRTGMAYCSNVSCPGRILESIVHFAA